MSSRLLQRLGLGTKQTTFISDIDCLKEKWAKYIEEIGNILKNIVETIFQYVS